MGIACLLAAASALLAPGGVITGRVVLDGEAPAPVPVGPGRDTCCIEAAPMSESWVVDPEGGLANVVVWIPGAEAVGKNPPPVEMRNEGCAFRPRVAVVGLGQPFALVNADPTTHNMNSLLRRNGAFNLVLPPGDRREIVFDRAETRPAAVGCGVHPFMRGYLFVTDAPVAVTDAMGRFELPVATAGEVRCRFWHEGLPLEGIELSEGGTTDRRGEARLVIPPEGVLDLGEVRVSLEPTP